MKLVTKIIRPRSVKVGDLLATTNGMREVFKVERRSMGKPARVYRVDITVQDVMSDSGTEIRFFTDALQPNRMVTVQRRRPTPKVLCEVCGGAHVEEYHTPANV